MANTSKQTDKTGQAGENGFSVGVDAARRSAETARETMQTGLSAASEIMQRSADQFLQAFGGAGQNTEELSRKSSQNLEVIAQTGSVLTRGAQEVSREWLRLTQERVQKNLEAANALAGCRSLPDLMAVQSGLVRDAMQQMLDDGRRLAELSAQVAEEAATTMSKAETGATRIRRAA
jgi:phasin family protein